VKSRFVRPETVTLTISDDDTLLVKKQLNRGEREATFARMYADRGGKAVVDALQVGLAIVTAYLIDWSLRDENGDRVVIRGLSIAELEQVLNSLSPEDFEEIRDAIDAHVETQEKARIEAKKAQGGTPVSEPISPSPSGSDGPTTISETSIPTSTTSS
jgi:hypothetical protein